MVSERNPIGTGGQARSERILVVFDNETIVFPNNNVVVVPIILNNNILVILNNVDIQHPTPNTQRPNNNRNPDTTSHPTHRRDQP